jgi:transcriptional regulator with XRE-family HTH domain
MSSTIMHDKGFALGRAVPTPPRNGTGGEPETSVLVDLCERVRTLRSARGMTRKALKHATSVSKRHLSNLEYGVGNASVLTLLQVAQGDLRPMVGNKEALDDLKHILAGRTAFYSKAEHRLDTGAQALDPTFIALRMLVREALNSRVNHHQITHYVA